MAKAATQPQLTQEEKFNELMLGAEGAVLRMHNRDFYRAADAITAYLGRDTLAEKTRAEYEALPKAKKEDMEKRRGYGKYGLFHRVSRPEVSLALVLAAHEMLPEKKALEEYHRKQLAVPGTLETISARFPEMTLERVQKILAL